MDLSKFDVKAAAEKGAFLHLRNPFDNSKLYEELPASDTGDEPERRPIGMTLRGRDSAVIQTKTKEIERRRMEGEEITDAEASMELLAASIISWQGIALPGSTDDAKCTFENAMAVFSAEETSWVVEQASMFAAVRRNFIGNVPSD